MQRRNFCLALAGGTLGSAAFAQGTSAANVQKLQLPAQVKLMVGYSAAGPVDLAARMVAPYLSRELGVPVLIENRPGANATIAGDAVAKATPDSSVLWFAASPTLTISPHLMKMSFEPARDVTPLSGILSYYNVLVVNKDLPFRTVAELVEFARANPGKVTYGSAGIGGSNHLAGELLADRTHTKMLHVPYKGNSPAMTDLMGGQLTMMFDVIGNARSNIAAEKVRALAVTSPRRSPVLPGVPTMDEAGVKDCDVGGWFAVYGPPKMPPALAAGFTQAIGNALKEPELRARMEAAGYEVWAGTPAEMELRAGRERAIWGTVTKGIKVE